MYSDDAVRAMYSGARNVVVELQDKYGSFVKGGCLDVYKSGVWECAMELLSENSLQKRLSYDERKSLQFAIDIASAVKQFLAV